MAKKLQEDKNVEYIESRYMYEKRQSIYIANEEANQVFDSSDIPDVIAAWNNGWNIQEIAEYLGVDRYEMELFVIDLIKKKKIKGNIHFFKPKKRGAEPMGTIRMDEHEIRVAEHGGENWVCLKDVWDWIRKPKHSYRKVTEGWGPKYRAKFKLETNGGHQKHIFLSAAGIDKIKIHCKPYQSNRLILLKRKMEHAATDPEA